MASYKSYTQQMFDQLTSKDKDNLLSFLEDITEGDVRKWCRTQHMLTDRENALIASLDNYQGNSLP